MYSLVVTDLHCQHSSLVLCMNACVTRQTQYFTKTVVVSPSRGGYNMESLLARGQCEHEGICEQCPKTGATSTARRSILAKNAFEAS